jgi:hypothetical protein
MAEVYAELNAKPALPADVPAGPPMRFAKQLPELTQDEQLIRKHAEIASAHRQMQAYEAAVHEQTMAHERRQTDQARADAVVNRIAALQSDIDRANGYIEEAQRYGDYATASQWEAYTTKKEAELEELDRKFDQWTEYRNREQFYPPPPRQPTISEVVEANGIGAEKAWMYQNAHLLQTEAGQAQVRGAALNSVNRGFARGTEALVRDVHAQIYGRPLPRAETRQAMRVTLTKDDRDMARRLGVDETTWARNKLELGRRKSAGFYQE